MGIYANDIRQAFIAAVMPRLLSYVQIPICTNKRQSFSSGTINPKQTNKTITGGIVHLYIPQIVRKIVTGTLHDEGYPRSNDLEKGPLR